MSFNGRIGAVAPTPGDYTASDIANDTVIAGANMAEVVENLDAADLGVPVIKSLADLDAAAPADGGGIRTINGTIVGSDVTITLPAGERIVYGPTGVINTLSTSARFGITGDVDGPLISGPIVMVNVALTNINAGLSAEAFRITSAVGRVCRMEYCSITGGVRAGTIGPVDNVVAIDRLLVIGTAEGIQLAVGQPTVITEFTRCAFALQAGGTAISIPDNSIIARGLGISGCSFFTAASTDRAISVGAGVILAAQSPMIAIQITESKLIAFDGLLTGLGKVWDDGPGTLPRSDVQLALKGNVSEPDSIVLGDADFRDEVTPIITTWPGPAPNPWVRIAHQNAGATSLLTLLAISERFILFRNGADPLDWYIQYVGPNSTTANMHFSIASASVIGGGAGEIIEYRLIKSTGLGPFAPITNSDRALEQRAAYQNLVGLSTDTIVTGDRFAIEHRNLTGVNSTKTSFYDIVVRG